MTINFKNFTEASMEIYLHDYFVAAINPDLENQSVRIVFKKNYTNDQEYKILTFTKVDYFEMSSYAPIVGISDIDCLYFSKVEGVKERFLHFLKEGKVEGYRIKNYVLLENKICPAISFMSGDILRIICSSIEVSENM